LSSGKKALLFLFLFLTVAGIAGTVYVALQQQEIRGRAAPATTLSFDPAELTKGVNDTFTLNINIDTGSNSVTGAELHIQYDNTKLNATSIDVPQNGFLPIVLVDGTAQGGFAFITVGSSPSDPKKGAGTVATITFKALQVTGAAPTQVRFTTDTRVAGIGEGSINVLAGQPAPAAVIISATALTSTPTPTTRAFVPSPTSSGGVGGIALTPSPTRSATISASPTATVSATPTKIASISASPTLLPTSGTIPVTGDIGSTMLMLLSGAAFLLFGAIAFLLL
jgi:hypothetical protein